MTKKRGSHLSKGNRIHTLGLSDIVHTCTPSTDQFPATPSLRRIQIDTWLSSPRKSQLSRTELSRQLAQLSSGPLLRISPGSRCKDIRGVGMPEKRRGQIDFFNWALQFHEVKHLPRDTATQLLDFTRVDGEDHPIMEDKPTAGVVTGLTPV